MIRGFQLVRNSIRWALEQDMPVAIAADLSNRTVHAAVQRLLEGIDRAMVKEADKEQTFMVTDIQGWHLGECRVLLLPIENVEDLDQFLFGNYVLCKLREERLMYKVGDKPEFGEYAIYPTIEVR